MKNDTSTIKTADVVWRKDLYPRFEHDPATVQQYAESLDVLPPIEINQHNELIDGYHRWMAHKKQEASDVTVVITQTASDAEVLTLAIKRNATHGLQLNIADKRRMCRQIYNPPQTDKKELAATLSVTLRTITDWVKNIDQQHKEDQKRRVREMWLACRTQDEIADTLGITQKTISNQTKDLVDLESFPNLLGLHAKYGEPDWKPPLFNIWNFAKNANKTKHFGNTHVGIVDNLLYTFTEPFDVVIDPFGGGGSTIDICKKRLRRYWVSDRKPPVERPDIRTHDVVTDGVAGPYLWGDVALVYLDPPYWKQAQGEYSDDPTDLANMPLDEFNNTLTALINTYGKKLQAGAHVACVISPTQWPNEDKHIDMHDLELARGANDRLKLVRRAICPYSTEQYNGTQVDIAKAEKLWLVLSRTLLVWQVVD
jgi:DNA-binding XRE family transcriptional regulator